MKSLLFSVTKKDLEFQTFRGSGAGGQHRNKTDSAVRCVHKESGAVGESQSERSQHVNKRLALKRMATTPRFRAWVARRIAEMDSGQTVEEKVEQMMQPNHLKIERRDENGKWQDEKK